MIHLYKQLNNCLETRSKRLGCRAKPMVCALIYFNDNDETNKNVRSANMLRRELRGRKIKRSHSIDAEERFHLSKKKVGLRQILHSCETRQLPRIDLTEPILKTRVRGWTDCGKNVSERLPQVPQFSRHRNKSRRTNGKMVGKKLVAATVSTRKVGLKRREEGRTMSSRACTETHKNQRDVRRKGDSGGRQKTRTR